MIKKKLKKCVLWNKLLMNREKTGRLEGSRYFLYKATTTDYLLSYFCIRF
jgi:predicted transcriptional regulator